nr:guanine nucleotide-binding protein G(I)/G(S)/G(O) subunit gamma-4-like [Camelus dromedarius]
MKEGMSSNSTTSISQARKAVEQLKMEACMDRVKVSQAADLLAYCEAHVWEDPLIIPMPASENHPLTPSVNKSIFVVSLAEAAHALCCREAAHLPLQDQHECPVTQGKLLGLPYLGL